MDYRSPRNLEMPDAGAVTLAASSQPALLPGSISVHAWALALLSGALQILIFPLPNWNFLAWLAVAPLMLAVLRVQPAIRGSGPATVRQAFALGYAAGVIWSLGTCYWVFHVMNSYGGLSTLVAGLVLVLFCLALGLFMGLFAALLGAVAGPGRLRDRAVLLAPVLWVAVELFRGYAVDFPWNPLGTVLVDNVPLSTLATVTGVYGLSFEILLINVVFVMAMLLRGRQRVLLLGSALVAMGVLNTGVLFSPPRLPADRTARLVQANVPILDANGWTPSYFRQTLASLADLSVPKPDELLPGEPRADMIIWPESPAPFFTSDTRLREAIGEIAAKAKAPVVAGMLGQVEGKAPAEKLFNSAAVIGPDGQIKARYDKVHLVPFGEYVPFQKILSFASKLTREVGDFVPGTRRDPIKLNGNRVAIFICYEAVFPNEVRQFANHGAQVFVNISNDGWFGDTAAPVQHLNQARMRAIENRRWLLRDTNTGITAVIDPYGRIVASAQRNVQTVIDVPYTLESETTFYTRHGDWFACLCAIITLALMIWTVARTRERSRDFKASGLR